MISTLHDSILSYFWTSTMSKVLLSICHKWNATSFKAMKLVKIYSEAITETTEKSM